MTRPTGEALARLKARRVWTLRDEGFTEREIVVFVDRRISSRGMLKIRRERAAEVKGLTLAERREWAEQVEEAYDEQHASDALRRVSPDE